VSLSTHVLDAMTGAPAAGLAVRFESQVDGSWQPAGEASTFDTGDYFARTGVRGFYPEVTITFEVVDPAAHYHVPLLLSPFAYSTYRGS
jgi:5-hydroxyisourate hydrolase